MLFPPRTTDAGKVPFVLEDPHFKQKITVETNPPVARVGAIDVSVMIQDLRSGQPRFDLPVTIEAYPASDQKDLIGGPATNQGLAKSRRLEISEPGNWMVEVKIQQGAGEETKVIIPLQVGKAIPAWMGYLPWIGWPLLAVVFFFLHHYLLRRRQTLPRLIRGVK